MKRLLLVVFFLGTVGSLSAQNLQLHYDFGNFGNGGSADRNYLTTTLEMFKPYSWGATFWFVDFNYDDVKGMNLAYFEIAQGLKLPKFELFDLHVEYNDGFVNGFAFDNVFLGGIRKTFNVGKKLSLTTILAYRHPSFTEGVNGQFTLVWLSMLANNKITLTGFTDVWTTTANDETKVKLLTEPQFWYNITPKLSVGTEIEISYNFATIDEFEALPTLGAKWTF